LSSLLLLQDPPATTMARKLSLALAAFGLALMMAGSAMATVVPTYPTNPTVPWIQAGSYEDLPCGEHDYPCQACEQRAIEANLKNMNSQFSFIGFK